MTSSECRCTSFPRELVQIRQLLIIDGLKIKGDRDEREGWGLSRGAIDSKRLDCRTWTMLSFGKSKTPAAECWTISRLLAHEAEGLVDLLAKAHLLMEETGPVADKDRLAVLPVWVRVEPPVRERLWARQACWNAKEKTV
ncbi:hypothetical protein BaRGS_00002663 [Batillaria attramentaria]|uniref:Uncharacterized protein n=1 Tax=Batillaria attramentaria TaxID=370345 RepID=A0ABD0M359_9CAEN